MANHEYPAFFAIGLNQDLLWKESEFRMKITEKNICDLDPTIEDIEGTQEKITRPALQ